MRARWAAVVASAVVVASMASGCGAAPSTVQVEAREFAFTPAEVRLQRGHTYALRLHNAGTVLHDLSIDRMPAKDVRVEQQVSHGAHSTALHVAADKGGSATLTFTPTEAGTYDVICTEPGHRDAGMTARVVVE